MRMDAIRTASVLSLLVGCCVCAAHSHPQANNIENTRQQVSGAAGTRSLESFLIQYLFGPPDVFDRTAAYSAASVNLDADAEPEIIVYLTGRTLCGSGGCTTLILDPDGATYRILGDLTISRPPIRVLRSTSKGLHDIGVWLQGGGILPGYEALLPFDGKQYPRNPTVAPARRLRSSVAGRTVIPRDAPDRDLLPSPQR
jgi:hypothetical protein